MYKDAYTLLTPEQQRAAQYGKVFNEEFERFRHLSHIPQEQKDDAFTIVEQFAEIYSNWNDDNSIGAEVVFTKYRNSVWSPYVMRRRNGDTQYPWYTGIRPFMPVDDILGKIVEDNWTLNDFIAFCDTIAPLLMSRSTYTSKTRRSQLLPVQPVPTSPWTTSLAGSAVVNRPITTSARSAREPRQATTYGQETATYAGKCLKLQTLFVSYARKGRSEFNELVDFQAEWDPIVYDLYTAGEPEGLIAACDMVALLVNNAVISKGTKQLSNQAMADALSNAATRAALWKVTNNMPVQPQPKEDEVAEVIDQVTGWFDRILGIGKRLTDLGDLVSPLTLTNAALDYDDTNLDDWEPTVDDLVPYSNEDEAYSWSEEELETMYESCDFPIAEEEYDWSSWEPDYEEPEEQYEYYDWEDYYDKVATR